tara:strand:- start:21591 stop:22688 length:1098 start_codon:yes stop_codon:yes gene_type:complete
MSGDIPYYGASGIIDYVNKYLFDEQLILLGEDGENILSRNLPLAFLVSGKTWVNNHAHVLRPGPQVDAVFLTTVLESIDFADYNSGTAQPKLNKKTCKAIPIAIPPLHEQRKIGKVLSCADQVIDSLQLLITKKQRIKLGAMQVLLTGKRRLPGFTAAWNTYFLGKLGQFTKGRGIKRDEVESEGLPCIRYGELYTRYHNYVVTPSSRIPASVATNALPIKSGDILFAGSGETAEEIGRCVAYIGNKMAYAGGDIVILSPNEQDSVFLAHLLNQPIIASQKAKLGQGDAVVHIHANHLKSIQVSIPGKDEQQAISRILIDMDAEINALQSKLTKAKNIKQGMIQQLLTGRIRLPVSEPTEERAFA